MVCACAVLRVFLLQPRSSQPYIVSLSPHSAAWFRLPPLAVAHLSSRLCSNMLVLQAMHWTVSGNDARPRLNSSTPLFANLTQLEVGTICANKLVQVS